MDIEKEETFLVTISPLVTTTTETEPTNRTEDDYSYQRRISNENVYENSVEEDVDKFFKVPVIDEPVRYRTVPTETELLPDLEARNLNKPSSRNVEQRKEYRQSQRSAMKKKKGQKDKVRLNKEKINHIECLKGQCNLATKTQNSKRLKQKRIEDRKEKRKISKLKKEKRKDGRRKAQKQNQKPSSSPASLSRIQIRKDKRQQSRLNKITNNKIGKRRRKHKNPHQSNKRLWRTNKVLPILKHLLPNM